LGDSFVNLTWSALRCSIFKGLQGCIAVHIGPVNPAEGVHKVHVLVPQTLDGIPEILFRGKQKSAGQKQSHRDLRVQRENGIVDVHRLELQIFGERLNCCVHFGVFNLITWG